MNTSVSRRFRPRVWHWLLLGLLTYALALLISLPAALVHDWSRERGWWPQRLQAGMVSGSLWSGRIQELHWDEARLGGLRWRWLPGQALRGTLGLQLDMDQPGASVSTRLLLDRAARRLQPSQLDLSAAWLAGTFIPLPLQVQGRLVADPAGLNLAWQQEFLLAQGRLVWIDAALGFSRALPLGDLQASLAVRDGQLVLDVSDQGGPLILDAAARLDLNGGYHIEGELGLREGADPELAALLASLGRPDARGRVPFAFSGGAR